jgi:DNA polymerase III epsilon subunit-like protein
VSSDNNFAEKAISNFISNKDISLSVSLPSIKADDSKTKEESSSKKIEKEKDSKAQSAYEDYLENWQQGDPLPLIPPGKELVICRVNLDETRAEKTAGYYDVPELTKKPYKKSSPEEDLIQFKNLGPKLSENILSLIGRVAKSRGLWIDDKNKLRCPPGTPAANQFTDITGSNCFIPSPQTAAGSARRAVRRAVNAADILSSPVGGRTDVSIAGTEQRVQAYTTNDFDMVHAAMGVGGRIGMPGPVWQRGRAVREAPKGSKKSWQLSSKEQRERGKILTTQAEVLHRRFMGQGAPLGLTRNARATTRAMDRQIASPSAFLLPSGNPVGDILNKGNFMRAMQEILPNVDPNELEYAFDNAIPAGLTLKERMEAQVAVRTFFEGMIFEAIQNPEHFKWITQFNTGLIGNDPLCAFEVKVSPFAPSPLSGGRRAGVAVTNLARSGTQVGETGGMHVSMNFNPTAAYLYTRQAMRTKFSDGSGEFDSIAGRALYLGVHESGHVVDFGEKFKALGLDPSTLSRYGRTTTLVSTASGPARQPNFYSGGWDIDWSMVRNPAGNASVQEMMDAAAALQTRSYTGSRYGGRRIDLQDDLNKFHLGFSDAFINNINTTEAEHELMAQFAGGDYAASNPVESRAEFYVARRLFGESTKFPSTVYPSSGPIKTGIADMNLLEKFAESEGLRRATSEAESGLIPKSDIPIRSRALQGVVLNELKNAGRDTFGIPAGGWNVSGLMSVPERNGRVSLHARRVQDYVAAADIQTQRARRGTNIPTGVSGKMATPEIRKPSRPREPDNGPYTGRFLEIFSGVRDFEEFRARYRKQDVVYFDYETTGFGADGNMPVQIGAVRMRGGQVVERFNIFVNPGIPLGEWAQKNLKDADGNPLTDSWLANQASLRSAHEQLIAFFGEDALLGGQYTPFDLEVFDRVTKDLGISYKPGGVIDSKALADETLPRWTPENPDGPTMLDPKTGEKKGSNSLGPLAEYLGVDLGDGWHTADADAEASALVTERILDRAVSNQATTPKTILDPDEIPNIVERRRAKFRADMEQYERDKIDYEAAVSGKMSVPRFETANGSTYERQPDGRYRRRKDPTRSTTIDGPVEKVKKKTSTDDIVKDEAEAQRLRARQTELESLSEDKLQEMFRDGEYTYVVHAGSEEISGGVLDPSRSVGDDSRVYEGNTRQINRGYAQRYITEHKTNKSSVKTLESIIEKLRNGELIENPSVPRAQSEDDGSLLGVSGILFEIATKGGPSFYKEKGSKGDKPWPSQEDLDAMGLDMNGLIEYMENTGLPMLEQKVRAREKIVSQLEKDDMQFTSAYSAADVVSSPGGQMLKGYGGRYGEDYDPSTVSGRGGSFDIATRYPRQGIHVVRVKLGEDADRLSPGQAIHKNQSKEVHMVGRHEVVASLSTPTWIRYAGTQNPDDLVGEDLFKGWIADVVETDKAARAAEAAGKPADVVETTYDNTVFLTPDAKYAVQLAADRGLHLNSNGDLMGMSFDDRNLNTAQLLQLRRDGATFDEAFEKAGGIISHYPINRSEIRESPQVGLHPFEWDNDGKKTHTGSPVSAVTRLPGNDVDQTPSNTSGVSGKMTLAQAEARKSAVDDKLERYKKAVREYDETGNWNGADHGVVTALPRGTEAALYLDRPDITPRNLNFRDVATQEADSQGLTGNEKEKYIADALKQRRADMDRKIQFLEREQKLAERLLESKRVRSEQNVLDIEDISPEEIEKLKAEAAEIRRLRNSGNREDGEKFISLITDGDTNYITHAGEPELKGGVLQGSASIGDEASYQGGINSGAANTRGLNNQMVVGMKGNVNRWTKHVAVLDKAIKEAEENGTYTFNDVEAEYAFRDIDKFGDRIAKSNFGTVFDIASDIGFTKEQWIEKLKSRRNQLAKELEAEKNILARIEKDDYQFLSAELADRFASSGMGYFGRYAHRQIPAEIAKNIGGDTDISAMQSLGNKVEVKDPEMAERWLDSLRGTVWITKGTQDTEWTRRLGPTSEVQILGKTKPIVGFSSRKNDKALLEEILPALLVRAISDDKNNRGVIRPLAVAGRIDTSTGVSGKMTSAEKAAVSQDFTKEVLGKAKGFGFDIEAKPTKEKIDQQVSYLVRDASMMSKDAAKDITLPQSTIDLIKKGVDNGEIFTSSDGLGEQLSNLYLGISSQMPNEWPKGKPIPPHVALEITKQIHLARGDSAAAQKVDDFRQYLKTATPEQLETDMREAVSSFGKSIDTRVIVQTRSMKPFAGGQHSILTHHDIEERKKAGVQSMSFMGDSITSSARTKTEANLLGIPMDETPDTRSVRPSSGYVVTRKASQARVDRFRKLYGDDVQIMSDAPVGRPLEQLSQSTSKYGEAAFILRPEVADRTRIYNDDTVALSTNYPEPVQLSSVGDSGAFFGRALGMLYDYKTQETIPTPAGGFESRVDDGARRQLYNEALVLGRFKPEEIEVINAPLGDFRRGIGDMETSGLNPDFEGNISLLMDMAQTRDELNARYGIEVIPMISNSGFATYGTEDVELFNPSMTRKWFKRKYPDRKDENEIIPDDSVTPYEAVLRITIKDFKDGKSPLVEYRGPSGATTEERNSSRLKSVEAELDRAIKARQSQTGVSGRMSSLSTEQMMRRNESITKGIEENGGSWGGFVPDSYRENLKEINNASWAAGGQFPVDKPPTREEIRTRNASLARTQYEQIQKHIRGEIADSRFMGLELGFMQHLGSMTPEQFEQEFRDATISFHAGIDPRPRVQVPIPELTTILEHGYKTTHEIRSDHSSRPIRLPYEAKIGIHPNTPANLRPASGYIVHKDWTETELKAASDAIEAENLTDASPELLQNITDRMRQMKDGRGPVEIYGGTEIILRPEVGARTRYLEGDSLNTKGVPTPLLGNDIESIQYALTGGDDWKDTVVELLYGHWKKDHGATTRHRTQSTGPGLAPVRSKNSNYMEALIAGSFDSGDIEEIILPATDYVPYEWIFDSKPMPGRKQQVYGGQSESGIVRAPQFKHLSDEKHLIEKLGFSPEEAKIAKQIVDEKLSARSGTPGAFNKEHRALAAIAMRDRLQSRGIKLKIKTPGGVDIFDPKALFPDAGDGATAEEAIVMRVEARLREMVRERIAEAGRAAQKAAGSISGPKEKVEA